MQYRLAEFNLKFF